MARTLAAFVAALVTALTLTHATARAEPQAGRRDHRPPSVNR